MQTTLVSKVLIVARVVSESTASKCATFSIGLHAEIAVQTRFRFGINPRRVDFESPRARSPGYAIDANSAHIGSAAGAVAAFSAHVHWSSNGLMLGERQTPAAGLLGRAWLVTMAAKCLAQGDRKAERPPDLRHLEAVQYPGGQGDPEEDRRPQGCVAARSHPSAQNYHVCGRRCWLRPARH